MTITNQLGRPMLAAMFITGGVDQLAEPEEKTAPAEKIASEIKDHVDEVPLPDRASDLVRLNGAVQVAGGVLLAIGRFPRLASAALAASLVPTTLGAHRFWEIEDEEARTQQRIHFLKNLAMLGGLMISMGDTGRRPSLSWKAEHAVRARVNDAAGTADGLSRSASDAASDIGRSASDLGRSASGVASRLRQTASDLGRSASEVAGDLGRSASDLAGSAPSFGR